MLLGSESLNIMHLMSTNASAAMRSSFPTSLLQPLRKTACAAFDRCSSAIARWRATQEQMI
jgi:hypothetical protein